MQTALDEMKHEATKQAEANAEAETVETDGKEKKE